MTSASATSVTQRERELLGQIGGSADIGLETARRARAEGADIILTGRNPDRLERAVAELGALNSAALDATNRAALEPFFQDLPETIDHVMVTGPGPCYGPLTDEGLLVRQWVLPGKERALGPWQARATAEMQAIWKSLPLDAWMTVETTPLNEHPSD